LNRVRGSIDRRFFAQLVIGAFGLVLIAASLITVVEKPLTFSSSTRRFSPRVHM